MEKSGRILIVDDDPAIRDAITQALEDEGYQVSGASNGVDALSMLRGRAELPCLVLLDLAMPIMDGWEFRREQMSDRTLNSIPVIILSADFRTRGKAGELKANAYLEKPLSFAELLSAIEQYCPGPGSG